MNDIFDDKRSIKDIVIHELWLETRISKVIIEEIIMSQFKFIKYTAMPRYKNIWLQYFGLFGIKPGRLLHFSRNEKTKLECKCGWLGRKSVIVNEKECCPYCKKELNTNGIHSKN